MNVHIQYIDFTDGSLMMFQVFSVHNKQDGKDITLKLNKKFNAMILNALKTKKLATFLGFELKIECPKFLLRIHKTK